MTSRTARRSPRIGRVPGRQAWADRLQAGSILALEVAGEMGERKKYVKRPDQPVIAVQLALETSGFTYEKWGSTQRCKAGDWIVQNEGEVYTVDRDVFPRTYRPVGPGTYVKTTPIWAERADRPGAVGTKEGQTHYAAGDYLVFNEEHGGDPYAIAADRFVAMYEPVN